MVNVYLIDDQPSALSRDERWIDVTRVYEEQSVRERNRNQPATQRKALLLVTTELFVDSFLVADKKTHRGHFVPPPFFEKKKIQGKLHSW